MSPEQYSAITSALSEGRGAIAAHIERQSAMNHNGLLDSTIGYWRACLERNSRALDALENRDRFMPVASPDMLWIERTI
jgi:hypothetical protein